MGCVLPNRCDPTALAFNRNAALLRTAANAANGAR
jgi:hypothetical protein